MLPCSCFAWLVCVSTSVYQPCRGPQADTTCPEPSAFSAVPLSTVGHLTVGHSTFGPGPSQCDPLTTMGRQTVGTQSGPYGCQLRSSSPTSAGAQLGSAVQPHEYGGLTVQSTYFRNSKLPATLTSFYIAGEIILEVLHPLFLNNCLCVPSQPVSPVLHWKRTWPPLQKLIGLRCIR